MLGERICFISILALQVSANHGGDELPLAHGDGKTEGKDRIDEAMRVANADEPFAAKSVYLIRIVRDHVDVFDQLELRNSPAQLRMQLTKLANVKVTFAFPFVQEVCRRTHDADADDLVVERDEASPVVFFLVKDQRIVLVSFASAAVVPYGIGYL